MKMIQLLLTCLEKKLTIAFCHVTIASLRGTRKSDGAQEDEREGISH